jgi:hypothetical protein
VPAVETKRPSPIVTAWAGNPDRLKIAAIANKHFPEVVRGDTAATYAVVVLDASDNYVWSTYGNGAVQLVIGADKRTPGERVDFMRKNSLEYSGTVSGARGGGGGGFGGGGAAAGMLVRDTTIAATGFGARGRGGVPDSIAGKLDSVRFSRAGADGGVLTRGDSVVARMGAVTAGARAGGGGGAGGAMISRSAGGGAGVPAYGGFKIAGLDSGSYVMGFNSPIAVGGVQVPLNSAAGLQDPGNGESGIQGLKASALSMAEQYTFVPGQLAPQLLRILVVHLVPGTNWKGR